MENPIDAIELTRTLVQFDTVNPPGHEREVASRLATILEQLGFAVARFEFAPGRTTLLARSGGKADREKPSRPLCFTGHLDTVPLGQADWEHNPFAGEIVDGRLYGRGASDMKAGIAAFLAAVSRCNAQKPDLLLILTAGEETGCEGARHLSAQAAALDGVAALIVGEPTASQPLLGHKGAVWLTAAARGLAAHGSMPDRGRNAVVAAASMVRKLNCFGFNCCQHHVLGGPTINIGTIRGGQNINSVPDWAEIGLDIRTVPGLTAEVVSRQLEIYLGSDLHALRTELHVDHVWTDPEDPWIQRVFAIAEQVHGRRPNIAAASFFSDASVLQPLLNDVPTVILGPGDPAMAHQTDEYCSIRHIEQAVEIYERIIMETLAEG